MQVRRGTGRVNALDVRDQQASAGHRDTLPEAGRDMLQMYPAEAQKRAQLGDAAQLAHRGPEWLRVAGRTPPDGLRAADTHHKLCGGVCEQQRGPRGLRMRFERFLMISCHLLTQLAAG